MRIVYKTLEEMENRSLYRGLTEDDLFDQDKEGTFVAVEESRAEEIVRKIVKETLMNIRIYNMETYSYRGLFPNLSYKSSKETA